MQELHNAVITGLGCVTRQGDFTLASPPAAGETAPGSGEIESFRIEDYLSSTKNYLDRCSALALAGCALALGDAGLSAPLPEELRPRSGITLGTHLGCLSTMKAFLDKVNASGARVANPILFSHSYLNSPISLCAIEFGLRGYHTTLCAGEASGLEAIRAAFDAIRLGHADIMLCGGVEALSAERRLFEPQQNAGEAAVFVVLENSVSAAERGAKNERPLSEDLFDTAAASLNAAVERFGHCGGATSGLSFALNL